MQCEDKDAILISPDAHCDELKKCYDDEDLSTVSSIFQKTACIPNDAKEATGSRKDCVLTNIDALAKIKGTSNDVDIHSLFVASGVEDRLFYRSKSKTIQKGESTSSMFQIQSVDDTKFTMLTITVVFRGDFVGSNYVPGDISVAFEKMHSGHSKVSDSHEVPDCEIVQVQNNSKHQLGIVLICIGCKDTTISDGMYKVILSASESASMSIAVRGSFAIAASTKVKAELAAVIRNERVARQSTHRASAIEPTIQLLKRKTTLEENLLHQAKVKCDECEFQIEELELQLDERDKMEDGGDFILKRMRILEEEYKHWKIVLDGR